MQRAHSFITLLLVLQLASLNAVADQALNGSLPVIDRLIPYRDADYGFSMAVPEGWAQIYAAESDTDEEALEPGYAIGFESPRSSVDDRFADYVMDFQVSGDTIDLIVYQAEIVELGFTVGIFVIGEQHESDVLSDAFELTLKTFKIPDNPFDVS